MSKLQTLATCALALAATAVPASGQSVTSSEEGTNWSWSELETDTPKTWHVMISVEQAVGPQGCDTYRCKVSTLEPIVIKGPPEVRRAHSDEIAVRWMMHVRENAPTAYQWLTTSAGHEPLQIYFRETGDEVMEAFRADGHLRKSRSCTGSHLVGLRTKSFEFSPPPGFAKVDFGHEPVPQGITITRDLPKVPGAR